MNLNVKLVKWQLNIWRISNICRTEKCIVTYIHSSWGHTMWRCQQSVADYHFLNRYIYIHVYISKCTKRSKNPKLEIYTWGLIYIEDVVYLIINFNELTMKLLTYYTTKNISSWMFTKYHSVHVFQSPRTSYSNPIDPDFCTIRARFDNYISIFYC